MNHYEPPKSDPTKNLHVADALSVQMTEDVYFTAKLQNRIRWCIVLSISIVLFFSSSDYIGYPISLPLTCIIALGVYIVLSKTFLPLANLTSTTKYKKFGDQLKMDKMNQKLGIGDYAKNKDE